MALNYLLISALLIAFCELAHLFDPRIRLNGFILSIIVVLQIAVYRIMIGSDSPSGEPFRIGFEVGVALWPLLLLTFCEVTRRFYRTKVKDEQVKLQAETALRLSQAREADFKFQAQRLESLAETGRMASGINREIQNVIGPIKSEVDALSLLEDAPAQVKDAVKALTSSLAGAERLMQSLKDLSKPIALKMERLYLPDLINEVLAAAKLLRPAAAVKFEAKIAPTALYACGDKSWLHQVLLHLVKNSVEALQDSPNPAISVSTAEMGSKVRIEVTDNGHGIDRESLLRIFEPFFSTKGAGGAGLGLVVSRKVVELHGGKMEVASEKGYGTTFAVLLPKEEGPQR